MNDVKRRTESLEEHVVALCRGARAAAPILAQASTEAKKAVCFVSRTWS